MSTVRDVKRKLGYDLLYCIGALMLSIVLCLCWLFCCKDCFKKDPADDDDDDDVDASDNV